MYESAPNRSYLEVADGSGVGGEGGGMTVTLAEAEKSTAAESSKYLIARDGFFVRSRPGFRSEAVRRVPYGTRFHALTIEGDWARVTRRSPRRVATMEDAKKGLGWVPVFFLSDVQPPDLSLNRFVDAPGGLDVRSDQDLGAHVAGVIAHRSPVTVVTMTGIWAQISAPMKGWVLRHFLTHTPPNEA